jgi:hypothetical protein
VGYFVIEGAGEAEGDGVDDGSGNIGLQLPTPILTELNVTAPLDRHLLRRAK